jgi:hypothetical protein
VGDVLDVYEPTITAVDVDQEIVRPPVGSYGCGQAGKHRRLWAMEASGLVICPVCGDRIGVYEWIVAVTPSGARETSRALAPWLEDSDAVLVHAKCSHTATTRRADEP